MVDFNAFRSGVYIIVAKEIMQKKKPPLKDIVQVSDTTEVPQRISVDFQKKTV